MNLKPPPATISRRTLFSLAFGSLAFAACDKIDVVEQNPMATAAPFVKPREIWSADHFFLFLSALPPSAFLQLMKSQGMLKVDAVEADLRGGS